MRNAADLQRADPDEIMPSTLKQSSRSNSDVPIREPATKTYRAKNVEAEENACEPAKLLVMECVELIVNLLKQNPATHQMSLIQGFQMVSAATT